MSEADLYARAGRIFDELVDLDPLQREAGLARAAERDPQAAQLARKLVAQDGEPSPFVLGGVSELDTSDADPAGVLSASVGPYEIEALLGRGGMGAVYLGRRREPEARVAIKFVTLAAPTATALERFRSEAEVLASLEHPGIVRYRDSGVDRRGRPFLVMDFVDGEPISHALAEIAASVECAVSTVVAIAGAVHHLHQRGVLHRDLKPSNILVRRDGSALVPTLIDFGIARALVQPRRKHPAHELDIARALDDAPLGTPAFMSPEQSRGGAAPDVRTDVHALGAVLYALLTGHPPRDLDQSGDVGPGELHARLREAEARPPSERVDASCFGTEVARRRARRIDRDLDAVVLKALALEPSQRFGSAEAFAADLERWLAHVPVTARRVGPLARLFKTVRRRPFESALVAASIALLAGASVWTSVSRVREVRARQRYAEQLATTEKVHRFYIDDVFARAAPDLDGPETPVIEVLRDAARTVGERLGDEPALAVALRSSLIGVFERLGAHPEADEQLAGAAALASDLPAGHPERLRLELERALLLTHRSRFAEAEPILRSLLERLARAPAALSDLEAWSANTLADVLLSRNELDEAQLWLARAAAGLDRRDPRFAEILNNRALLAWSRGDLDAAASALEELLHLFEGRFGATHPYVGATCSNLASLHLDRREPRAALPYARRALAIFEEHFDPTHLNRLSALNQIASCQSALGEYDEALELRRAVYAGRRERLGPDNASVGEALSNLASTLVRAGRAAEALAPAREAFATLERTLGERNPSTAKACLALAYATGDTGDFEQALALIDRAIEMYESADGDHTAAIGLARDRRASIAAEADD